MADLKMVVLAYKPKEGNAWVKSLPEAQANKMLKMGRWKKATEAEKKTLESAK